MSLTALLHRHSVTLCGWLLAVLSGLLYALTMSPTVALWDCGEFIAVACKLEVGHPPGAPLYVLLAHLFCLLGHGESVAWWCNLFSAASAGLTVMFIYWILQRMMRADDGHVSLGAVVGALCYAVAHTVWTSATESEVYATAMLVSAVEVWAALKWSQSAGERPWRWLLFIALLAGAGICIHFLTLLALPAVALVVLCGRRGTAASSVGRIGTYVRVVVLALLFFVIGISPYMIIPIRAKAGPPLNFSDPSTLERFEEYVRRDDYVKAPLFPRIWQDWGSYEDISRWTGCRSGFAGELCYYFNYQLCYMYFRYLSDNFIARINAMSGRTVWYVLPLLLAVVGVVAQAGRSRKLFWTTMLLFLFGGPLLNFYLNHPCYEPRERDYIYVLSYFAVAIWIGEGAEFLFCSAVRRRWWKALVLAAVVAAPALMFAGNLSDHDRSHNRVTRDMAANMLNWCEKDAMLFSWGDNDTFPVWYMQQVEEVRTDVEFRCINLFGEPYFFDLVRDNRNCRPCYLTQYAYDAVGDYFGGELQLEGIVWRILPEDSIGGDMPEDEYRVMDRTLFLKREKERIVWQDTTDGHYIDRLSKTFLRRYCSNRQKIVTLQQ